MSTSGQIYSDLQLILPDLRNAMEAGVQYGGELFDRFVIYEIVTNSIIAGSVLVIMSIASYFAYRYLFKRWDEWDVLDGGEALGLIMYIVSLTVLFFPFVYGFSNLVKIIFLPELRVIEVVFNLSL